MDQFLNTLYPVFQSGRMKRWGLKWLNSLKVFVMQWFGRLN